MITLKEYYYLCKPTLFSVFKWTSAILTLIFTTLYILIETPPNLAECLGYFLICCILGNLFAAVLLFIIFFSNLSKAKKTFSLLLEKNTDFIKEFQFLLCIKTDKYELINFEIVGKIHERQIYIRLLSPSSIQFILIHENIPDYLDFKYLNKINPTLSKINMGCSGWGFYVILKPKDWKYITSQGLLSIIHRIELIEKTYLHDK
ncbi:MAG: hypothetical protein E6772_03810 [Dysgonomonas sp.]|nr:hypothetical protein [Dysgonomonas sp.]